MRRWRTTVGPLVLLLAWLTIAYSQAVSPLFVPSPLDVLRQLATALRGGMLPDVEATVWRVVLGFVFGGIAGVTIGVALGASRWVQDSMEFVVDFSRSVPVLALFPLFLLIFGIGDLAKVATAAWSTGLIVLVNAMYAVRNTNRVRLLVVSAFRATRWQTFWKVVLPDALPGISVGLRSGLSMAVIVVVVTEMFTGTREGLGLRIYDASLLYETGAMYAGICLTGVLGYLANRLYVIAENRLIHWSGR